MYVLSYLHSQQKALTEAWKFYAENPTMNDFPPSKLSHDLFNFTNYIYDEFDVFVKAILESSLKLKDESFLNFDSLYPEILSPRRNIKITTEKYHFGKYFYDKLFFGCSYGEEIDFGKALGGCPLFQTVLTNNGICYSFNGQKPSHLFQDGKIVNTIETITNDVYPENKMFQGPGLHDGKH